MSDHSLFGGFDPAADKPAIRDKLRTDNEFRCTFVSWFRETFPEMLVTLRDVSRTVGAVEWAQWFSELIDADDEEDVGDLVDRMWETPDGQKFVYHLLDRLFEAASDEPH